MKKNVSHHRVSFTLATLFGLAVLGQGCASASGDPTSTESAGESQSAVTASVCPGTYENCNKCSPDSCGQPCCAHDREPGYNEWEVDDCQSYAKARYVVRPGVAPVICDIEAHTSLGGVSVDIYAATQFQDTSCAPRPDAWQKTLVGNVHCSLLEAITEATECGKKVFADIAALTQRGYQPIVSAPGQDKCPMPRL